MKKALLIFLILISFSCNNKSKKNEIPNEFIAKVIGIKDGDTIEVLYKNHPIVIRFEHIDCPEKKQPFGKKAKQFVSNYVFGKKVKIISKGKTDRWKRIIAVIELQNGNNLNKMLVQNGLAMHFKRYSKDNSYDIIEKEAKKNKVGIWSKKKVIEPWNYRKKTNNRLNN